MLFYRSKSERTYDRNQKKKYSNDNNRRPGRPTNNNENEEAGDENIPKWGSPLPLSFLKSAKSFPSNYEKKEESWQNNPGGISPRGRSQVRKAHSLRLNLDRSPDKKSWSSGLHKDLEINIPKYIRLSPGSPVNRRRKKYPKSPVVRHNMRRNSTSRFNLPPKIDMPPSIERPIKRADSDPLAWADKPRSTNRDSFRQKKGALSPRKSVIFRSREDLDNVVLAACNSSPTFYSNEPLNLKIALVGQKGCGKTCFTERRTINLYSDSYEETVEITRHTKECGATITWYDYGEHFWEQPVREDKIDVLLLCYDVTNWSSMDYLVKQFEKLVNAPKSQDRVYFILGNKLDLKDSETDNSDYGKLRDPFLPDSILCKILSYLTAHVPLSFVEYMSWKYFKCDVFEVSAKENTNISYVLNETEILDLKENFTSFHYEEETENLTPGTVAWTPSPERDWDGAMSLGWNMNNNSQTQI